MTKEEKRQRIAQIETCLQDITNKEGSIEQLKGELQRQKRTLGLKLFSSWNDNDEDYQCKTVWIEKPEFISPSTILKLYEAELAQKREDLMNEMNQLIS